ncbi:hypothetical protein AZE42_09162 [Rhizopogon vesiculosus]|uniref:BTB domain-containing protein n=1 Tax=Rhizopogon vesiculosus TaxID=180088 RepID=A0A1J8Q2I8_9AGAM|nr:hypothetical protein AZE42_09162 [Rhizopogon vesiculosus]
MSTPEALVEALLMKSILGEELVDTKFHLFSGRSIPTCNVTRLQALSANDVVLTSRSDFFAGLLSKVESSASDPTFIDFDDGSALEDNALDDYGYASDSDLEDEEEEQVGQTQASDESIVTEDARSKVDSTPDDPIQTSQPHGTMPTSALIQRKPRFVHCRNILVRDTAFRTWKALILYLYTDKIAFSRLKSQGQPRVDVEASKPSTSWSCSPKSMYRLACKVGLDRVRDRAFSAMRGSLNEENILHELSSSFTSKYPAILQMQVEVLLKHIASVPVMQNIPSLIRRIADSQLPHGADIIIDLYQKVLLRYHPQPLAPANAPMETLTGSPFSKSLTRKAIKANPSWFS